MKLYNSDFNRFMSNVCSMCIYALLFGGIMYIGNFDITSKKSFAISLLLGFFAGLLNDIGRKIEFFHCDVLEQIKKADRVETAMEDLEKKIKAFSEMHKGKSTEDILSEMRGKENPAWSEEDEEHINSLLKRLEGLCREEFTNTRFAINEDEDWLKSLKDRVQPKHRKENSMTDKVQKIREAVVEIVNSTNPFIPDEDGKNSNYEAGKLDAATKILQIIDSLEEPVSKQKLSNVQRTGKDWKEPVSEDLEGAAKHYLYNAILYDDIYVGEPTEKDCIECFKAGANWQKEQMMAKVIDVEVKIDAGGYLYIPQIELYDYDKDMPLAKKGDKYKVILIKED